ncbi:MAG: ABC transporter substrate-binding protein, partial [Candidatus Omnitrophica bacterium]|nr:ABC transporter substrate-binding protein [Candidatus Omnitrophota bacterium]
YPDSRSLWTAFMRGEADFVLFIEREDYEVIKDDDSFNARAFPFDYYYAIVYNLNDPILANKIVREAIAYGIDRKSLIERVAFGYGLECNSPFYPDSLGFNPEVKAFVYNSQKAQALLAEAGWKDTDNDGILEKQGEELEIKILIDTRNEEFRKIAMVLRQQLQEIGIKISVVLYDEGNVSINQVFQQHRPNAQLKLFLAGGDPDQTREYWCAKELQGADKLWVYKNEEVDRLFSLGEITQDKEKRQKIYQKIHRIIYEDQPACFLYSFFTFHAVSNRFRDANDFFTLNMPFYTMKDWYLKTQISADEKPK